MTSLRTTPSKIERTPTKIDRTPISTPGGSRAKEEKILVTVRVRPLSKREIGLKDSNAWECMNDQTITYKGPSLDRVNLQLSYTFDKVFAPSCATEAVYEQGAKDVALSALNGINATIFAYGQTSSGKTYTMRGVTENAVSDIYRHISNSPEREFVIKISAMEIYNEVVRDLLKPETGPLRLLDDPEKGTIVEKLEETTAVDSEHLKHLISICEEQRQVGETSLNDTSSRSHQIIRLIVESRLREKSGCVKSYMAALNFVDLAGSERAAQTHAIGARLKEGCHINRSLLTLTTVIRKLSTEKKNGHIPYRDSKLTRILQLSLGGNARTAIICTMSPALSHVEQSRNTLFFATCAKEVTNTAQVNMVVSDKQLVKNLQMEVARLEAELRTPDRANQSEDIVMEKERKIKQMEVEMEELKKQRDLAQLQLDELKKKIKEDPPGWNPFDSSPAKRTAPKCLTFSGPTPLDLGIARSKRTRSAMRQSSTVPFMLVNEIRKLEQLQMQLNEEANHALEVLQKQVASHKLGNQDAAETLAKLQAEIREMRTLKPVNSEMKLTDVLTDQDSGANLRDEITRLHMQGNTIENLEAQLENVQKALDNLVMSLPNMASQSSEGSAAAKQSSKSKKKLPLGLSNSINRPSLLRAPCSPHSHSKDEVENHAPENGLVSHGGNTVSEKATPTKSEDAGNVSSREGTPQYSRSSSVTIKKMQKIFQNAAEENVRSITEYVTELKERVAKLQYQKQLLVCQVLELESNENKPDDPEEADAEAPSLQNSPDAWPKTYRMQMQQIIQLWSRCHVPLVHRTQFYLLFRGDEGDQIYLEVELRRLRWLQQHLAESGDGSHLDALQEEREQLAKRMSSRLTGEQRERLYMKWNIPVEGKQRKLQLVSRLWTDPDDTAHTDESADIVARLVGFCEGGDISKEMFELNFTSPATRKPWLHVWQPISNLLRF